MDMDMMVVRLGVEKPVVIFSKSTCCMGHTVETLIRGHGANPTIYELDRHPEGRKMEGELRSMGCSPTVPVVFIGQQLRGGAKEVISLNVRCQLRALLIQAGAIWV